MSNLSSPGNVFDVLRGWPYGGAIEENFPVTSAGTVVEGQIVIVDSSSSATAPTVKLPTSVATEGANTGSGKYRMVIQGTDQFDGSFTAKCVTLRGAFTIQTGQFATASYAPGDLVTVDTNSSSNPNYGYLVKTTASHEEVLGQVESYDSTNGILVVSMNLR